MLRLQKRARYVRNGIQPDRSTPLLHTVTRRQTISTDNFYPRLTCWCFSLARDGRKPLTSTQTTANDSKRCLCKSAGNYMERRYYRGILRKEICVTTTTESEHSDDSTDLKSFRRSLGFSEVSSFQTFRITVITVQDEKLPRYSYHSEAI